MRVYCKNCKMECWKDDPLDMFSENGFGEDCALYIDKMTGRSMDELLYYEENISLPCEERK